jgi:hypothetical protein
LIASAHTAFDESGRLKSAEVAKRLFELGQDLTRFAGLHADHRNERH